MKLVQSQIIINTIMKLVQSNNENLEIE